MSRLDPAEPGRASSRDLVATMLIVAGTAALALAGPIRRALSPHPSREECAELVERWAEHSARQLDPEVPASTLAVEREQARAHVWTIARCSAELTEAEARCARDAHTADEFERCM